MKLKKIIILASICLLSSIYLFADEQSLFTFSFGLTTGHIFYGDQSYSTSFKLASDDSSKTSETTPAIPTEQNTEASTPDVISSDDDNKLQNSDDSDQNNDEYETISFPMYFSTGSEVLIGLTGSAAVNLTNFFSLYTDLDFSADFNWLDSNYAHHLDYSIAAGTKFYIVPNIKAISISISYLLGSRTDFFKYENHEFVRNTPFGNGIKVSAEYNFSKDGGYRFLPTIGCSWRYIPRGNYQADNIISAYAQANF